MRKTMVLTLAALVGAAAVSFAGPGNGHGNGGHATGRPTAAKSDLVPAVVDDDATGVIDVKHFPAQRHRVERSWLRVRARHLDGGATYTLWMDDPTTVDTTLVEVATADPLTTGERGGLNLRFDTRQGGALPFGSTLADLAGKAVEVRDTNGATVLQGTVPTAQ